MDSRIQEFGGHSLRHYLILNSLPPLASGKKSPVSAAFEAKAIDCHSGISPQNLSLWPILSKAVDCVVLVRVFNTLFLNDNSARRFRKVRKSTARVRESWIKPEH